MSNFTLIKKNPTEGEVTSSLTNAEDGGLHFDGAAGNIDIASPPDLGAKFSFEFIVKADEWGSNAGYLLDFSNGGRFIFGTTSSQSYNISIYDNSNWVNFGVKVLDDLKVHHLVCTVDGTAATLFDNGVSVGTATISASHGIDSCSDLTIGPGATGTPLTLSRTRFYNRTLSGAEVKEKFENQNIDFSEQWGSQTSKLLNGTAWTGASGTTAPNSWTTGSQGTYTIDSSSGSGSEPALKIARNSDNPYIHQNFTAVIGAKYRISYRVKNIDATQANVGIGSTAIGSQYYLLGYSSTSFETVNLEITSTTNLISVYLQAITSTGTQAVYFDSVEIKQVGCVSSYELQTANPSQSLMVQDSSGAGDATCSASGITQIQPLTQLNSKAISVSAATARTVSDGHIVADRLGAGIVPSYAVDVFTSGNNGIRTNNGTAQLYMGSTAGVAAVGTLNDNSLNLIANGGVRMTISSAGLVKIGPSHANEDQTSSLIISKAIASSGTHDYITLADTSNNGTEKLRLLFKGRYGTGSHANGQESAYISCNRDGGSDGYGLSFGTGNAADAVDRLTISRTGTVTLPKPQDTTTGTPFSSAALKLLPSGTTNTTGLTSIALSTSVSDNYGFLISGHRAASSGNPTLRISSHNNSSTGTEVLNISNAGMVNIGPTHGGVTFENTNTVTGSTVLQQTYSGSNPELRIGSNVSTGATSAMNVRGGDAGLVTFNGGINFTQTNTAATGATTASAVLNHYSEGLWTPILYKGSTVHTGANVYGNYVRIGKTIYLSFYFYQAAGGTQSASGSWRVGGLPFSVKEDAPGAYQRINSHYFRLNGTSFFNASPHAFQANDLTTLHMYGANDSTNWSSGVLEMSGSGVMLIN